MIIRMCGINFKEYCYDAINLLDAFIVCISVVDVIIDLTSAN